MKTTLCFAAVAAMLAATPAAFAQTSGSESSPPLMSGGATPSGSGRPDVPVVKSLPGAVQDQPRGTRPNRAMDRPAASQRAMNHDKDVHGDATQRGTMSGSTGDAAMNRDATGSSNRSAMRGTSVDRSDIATRRGRGQNDLELSQTSLLNQFSAAGYTMVRDFRKDGDRYVAQAQDRDGRWASVELNPRSGTITPR